MHASYTTPWDTIFGKAVGDKKTESEGKADQAKGKAQNAFGSAKDKLRGK